jgi:hypothetical protein
MDKKIRTLFATVREQINNAVEENKEDWRHATEVAIEKIKATKYYQEIVDKLLHIAVFNLVEEYGRAVIRPKSWTILRDAQVKQKARSPKGERTKQKELLDNEYEEMSLGEYYEYLMGISLEHGKTLRSYTFSELYGYRNRMSKQRDTFTKKIVLFDSVLGYANKDPEQDSRVIGDSISTENCKEILDRIDLTVF